MKRNFLLIGTMLALVITTLFLVIRTAAQSPSDSQPGEAPAPAAPVNQNQDSDSNPSHQPDVSIPAMYQPNITSTVVSGTPVYFTPQDENTSTTILFLYSTNNYTSTVSIQTYNLTGGTVISSTLSIPPKGLIRISADPVNTISASWVNPVVLNFTTFSTYAKMIVPPGVRFDGYVAWNNAATYDPLAVVPTLPLLFTVDPSSLFLPTLHR